MRNSTKPNNAKPQNAKFSNTTPPNTKRPALEHLWKRHETAQEAQETPRRVYDMRAHDRDFDVWQHGYIWKRGRMWYRRPDGVDVPAPSAVNRMNEFGELEPG